ncbi:chondroitinase-B domain-containing protein [Paenibacillus sp. GCM10023248]|uniref:polysaccharide lyase 6 family protein n=1 Tax=unclassified Paenibacillus TaxID=185978 RepID=UPI00237840BA|nr:polysaccharide lyase 6 family protein [Paenibacillus sp. MAHUQ-63]MDD9268410.1 polysaccharide lyase 6 family protein [Paenibacillus sp. MAHUQ-63]
MIDNTREVTEPNVPGEFSQAGVFDEKDVHPPKLKHIEVGTAAELQQALDEATAGTVIALNDGLYEQSGPFVVKDKQGSALLPIRIEAVHLGKAIITGDSYLHIEHSSYIEVVGLTFHNGIGSSSSEQSLIDRGLSHRILKGVHPGIQLQSSSKVSILRNTFALDETGQPYRFLVNKVPVWGLYGIENSCRYGSSYDPNGAVYNGPTPYDDTDLITDNGTHRHFIRVEGVSSYNRIAYNEIGPKRAFGAVLIYDGEGHSGQTISQHDVIEYNYFHDIGPRVTNGLEAIRLGLSSLSLAPGYATIQFNLFDGFDGEDEIVSVKSSDNIIRYNTIRNSYGGFVARHGHRNSFYGNFFFGDGKKPGMSGFRIYGNDHKIYNNYMEGLTDRVIRLDGGSHDAGPDGDMNPTVKWMREGMETSAVLADLPAMQRTELLRGHWRPYNIQIFNNTLVNISDTNSIVLGGKTYQPVGTKIYNNLILSHSGTMVFETTAVQQAAANERPIYMGNMVDGHADISNNAAVARTIRKEDIRFVRCKDGLIRLSAQSPAIDAAVSPLLPSDDMDGQFRYIPDIGADEYGPGKVPVIKPLTVDDVGPRVAISIRF